MLWYKTWRESRWRFLSGLVLLMVLACGIVFDYPAVVKLRPLASAVETGDSYLGRVIKEALDVQRDFRGFVWWQWVRQNLTLTWTLFAVLLGSGGLLSDGGGRGPWFTLSLPASRDRIIAVRVGAGLAELLVLALLPSLLIPLMSPAIGEAYPVRLALVHGMCLFIAGTAFFSLTLLLSTVFTDFWRPLLLACTVAVVLGVVEQALWPPYGIFRLMSGEMYFRTGRLPWAGLMTSFAVSIALLYGASINFMQRDF
jgi:ABC-2 type transport system permease protein